MSPKSTTTDERLIDRRRPARKDPRRPARLDDHVGATMDGDAGSTASLVRRIRVALATRPN